MPYSNPDGAPIGLYQGMEATPTQNYTEINSKKGEQQYIRLALTLTSERQLKLRLRPVINPYWLNSAISLRAANR